MAMATYTCGVCRRPLGNTVSNLSLDTETWRICRDCRKSFLHWRRTVEEDGLEEREKRI